jgi:plasmid stabilization system protein ParE
MKVVYTEDALKDLDAIADWLIVHYPAVAPAVERRIRRAVANIARWPKSAPRSARYPGIRVSRSADIHTGFSIVSRAVLWKYCTSITPRGSLGMNEPDRIALRSIRTTSYCQCRRHRI